MSTSMESNEERVIVTVQCPHHPQYSVHVELPKTRTIRNVTVPFSKCVRTIFIGCTGGKRHDAVMPDSFDLETTLSIQDQLQSIDFDRPPATFIDAVSETQSYTALDVYVAEVITDPSGNSPQYVEYVYTNEYVPEASYTAVTGLKEDEACDDTTEVLNHMRELHIARMTQGSSTALTTARTRGLNPTNTEDEEGQVGDAPLPSGQQRPAKQRKP